MEMATERLALDIHIPQRNITAVNMQAAANAIQNVRHNLAGVLIR